MDSPASSSRLQRWRALSGGERRLLFEAWWRLLAAAVRLRFAPRRALAEAGVESASQRTTLSVHESAGAAQELSRNLALAVGRAAAHHVASMTCLPRALALRRMLAARGVDSVLRIGVRKEAAGGGGTPSLAAHAWIEVDGQAIGEPEAIAQRFLPLVVPNVPGVPIVPGGGR